MKRTLFCRMGIIFLTLLMVIGTAACQKDDVEEPNVTQNQEEETGEISPIDALPTVTYGYETFTFLLRDSTYHFSDVIVEEFAEGSPEIDKAVYERNEAIMERYQVEFAYVKKPQDQVFKAEVITATSSGSDNYDAVAGQARNLFEGILSGLYTDWNELEYVNLDQPWWNQSAREVLPTKGGKLYAMIGDISYLSVGAIRSMFFNKTMIKDAGLVSPYDMVDQNQWTLSNFMTMVMDVGATLPQNESKNDIENGSFGYATNRWRGPLCIIYSTGVQALAKQEDGTYTIGLTDNRVIDAHSKFSAFITGFETVFWGPNNEHLQPTRDAFAEGRACFSDDNISQASVYKTTEVDYGIVPWPKYEEIDAVPAVIDADANTFGVLRNTSEENLSRISLILEAMAVYSHVDVLPYYFETILCLQGAKDERTRDMLNLIHDSAKIDFAQFANFGNIGSISPEILRNPGTYGTTLATGVTKIRSAVMEKLEDWYALDDMVD